MAEKDKKTESSRPESKRLEATLTGLVAYVEKVGEFGKMHAAGDIEAEMTMGTVSDAALAQTRKLTEYALDLASTLPEAARVDLDGFLAVQNGPEIADSGISLLDSASTSRRAGGFGKKLLTFILQWLQEIKKIVRTILEWIFGLLGMNLPKWIDALFLLIDEMKNFFVALLGDLFGIDLGDLRDEFSRAEVNYLQELVAFDELGASRMVESGGYS